MNQRFRRLALFLLIMLVALTGCQAIGGFDINKALMNNLKPISSESKEKLTIEIVPSAGNLSEEDKAAIELINSLSLTLDSVKMQDQKTASVKGSLAIKDVKLPFLLSIDKDGIAVKIEGAKQPIYISLDSYYSEAYYGMLDMSLFESEAQDFSYKALELLLKHAPNPANISVKQVEELVNGEKLNLTQLHLELNGEDLLSLAKPFLSSLVKDEQGIKELIGAYYDMFYPMMEAMYESYDLEGSDDYDFPQESREEIISEFYKSIQEELTELVNNYDTTVSRLMVDSPEFKTALGKNTVLKLDLFFDSKLNIRKQLLDLKIAIDPSEDMPIQAIKAKYDREVWNVGGSVKADKVDTSAGVLDVIEDQVTPGKLLRNFEAVPSLHKLLKDDLKITEKTVYLDPQNDYYGIITKQNTSFAPLRYIAEELDAEVKWVKGSKQITIIDDITGEKIVLTVGSNKASVNGKAVNLTQAPFVYKDGTTYVPLRFIAESLGADVDFDDYGWITIERD